MISKDSPNAISSPGSEDGPTRSDSLAGPTTDLFGQPVVHALPSRRQAKGKYVQNAKAHTLSGTLERLVKRYVALADTNGLPTPATLAGSLAARSLPPTSTYLW